MQRNICYVLYITSFTVTRTIVATAVYNFNHLQLLNLKNIFTISKLYLNVLRYCQGIKGRFRKIFVKGHQESSILLHQSERSTSSPRRQMIVAPYS